MGDGGSDELYVLSGHYGARWAGAVPEWQDSRGRWSTEGPAFAPFVLDAEPRRGEIVIGPGQVHALLAEGRAAEIPFPTRFRRTGGTRLGDLMWAGGLGTLLASDRLIAVLEQQNATGWRACSVDLVQPRGQRLEGYHGLLLDAGSGDVRLAASGEIEVTARIDRALREAGVTALERRRHVPEAAESELAELRLLDLDVAETGWIDPHPAALVTGDSPDWMLHVTASADAASWCPWWEGAGDDADRFWRVAYDLVAGREPADAPSDLHLRRSGGGGRMLDVMTSPEESMLPLSIVSDRFLSVLRDGGFAGWGSRPVDLVDGKSRQGGHHLLWVEDDPDGVHDLTGMEQHEAELIDVLPAHDEPGGYEIAGAELADAIEAATRWALPDPRFRFVEIAPAVLAALRAADVTGFDVRPTWSRRAQRAWLREWWTTPDRAVI